jgi:uncharacterized protein with von Willebrand factor type A (vWA) domain
MDNLKRVRDFLINRRMKKYLSFLGVRGSEVPTTKTTIFDPGTEGTSYTDGTNIYITIWESFLTVTNPVLKAFLEASVGHESEHIRSSCFKHLKQFTELIGNYYYNKYGIDKRVGEKFGASLYNICEDGRIERIYTYRFPGSIPSFQLLNGEIWRTNAIDINEQERSVYADLMSAILCLSKTGVKPKNWDTIYAGTEADRRLMDISNDISEIVDSNLTEDVIRILLIINDKLSDFVKEGLEKDAEFLKQLDALKEAGYNISNSDEKQQSQAGANGSGGGSAAHIGGNSAGNGSGQSQDMDSVMSKANANAKDKTEEDIEKEIEENRQQVENDTTADDMLQEGEKEAAEEAKNNSDDDISQDDLNKISKDSDIDIKNADITNYSSGITDANAVEPEESVKEKANYIYNQLKKLFIKRDNRDIRNLKKGRLDNRKLARYKMMENTSTPEVNIFKRNSKDIIPEVSVLGLADISGSTGGILFDKILDCLAIIEGGFAPLLPIKLMTYEGGYGSPNINVLKDFKNKIKRINYSATFKKIGRAGGGTPTAEAMAIGGYELDKRKEKKKLLFIITDGEPNDQEAVLKITKQLRRKGIKVVAILVQDRVDKRTEENFKKMYDDKDFITASEDEFASILIKLLTSWIKN